MNQNQHIKEFDREKRINILYATNFLHVPTSQNLYFREPPFWSTQSMVHLYKDHITQTRQQVSQ